MLFESEIGTLADRRNKVYLRPETAQGVFINFKNLIRSLRSNLPLTVAQIGRAFRNEITPAHLLFRGREFEQLEYESFIDPNQAEDTFNRHLELVKEFLAKLGLERNNLREREHGAKELAHYSKRTLDIEYNFPFGWGELLGIADRGSYDLTNHQKHSGQDMSFLTTDGSRFIPHIIETSIGVERLLLAILCDSFKLRSLDQKEGQKKPFFLAIKPRLAPYHLAILPLLTKHRPLALELYNKLLKTGLRVTFDSSGSIGRRYRRQDAIATPFVATIDEQSLTDKDVTIRFRDSMEQAKERVGFNELEGYISKLIFD